MGNQPTTGGSGPVQFSTVGTTVATSTSQQQDGLSTQLIIWGMVGFILIEVISIICLLRYCCSARVRDKKRAKELEIKGIHDLSKSTRNDVIDNGLSSIKNELQLQNKNTLNQLSKEFESLYDIDETKFSGTASFIESRGDFSNRNNNEPIETLEMLIDYGNKRISRKFMNTSEDTNKDNDEIILQKRENLTMQNKVEEEVTYEYDGVLNPIFSNSFNHAEIRPATPVRYEEARELRKREDNKNNNSLSFDSLPRVKSQSLSNYYNVNRFSYEIRDGEPVQWQVAKDLITPNWDNLKKEAEHHNERYANIIEPSNEYNNFKSSLRNRSRSPPISFISYSNNNNTTMHDPYIGEEAKPANKGLYSQLPFGTMKRLTTFQNSTNNNNNLSNTNVAPPTPVRTIKKILKDADTDEILSVKSFIDFTTTVNVVHDSNNLNTKKLISDDKVSIKTVSEATNTTNTKTVNKTKIESQQENSIVERTSSAKSNNTSNMSVIDFNNNNNNNNERKLSSASSVKTSSSSSNQKSTLSLGSQTKFPSPPPFGDDIVINNQNERIKSPTFDSVIELPKQFISPSNLNDDLQKSHEINEITLNAKSMDTSFNTTYGQLNNKKRSATPSVKSVISTTSKKEQKSQVSTSAMPLTNFLDEIRFFNPDSLKRTSNKTDMKVEYNTTSKSPPLPPPPSLPPLNFGNSDSAQNSPRVLSSVTLPIPSGLPDNPLSDRAEWSSVMKTFDENISGFSPKSLNNSLANLKAEIEESEKFLDAQLF